MKLWLLARRLMFDPLMLAAGMGATFAVLIYPIWRQESRWIYVIVIGFILVSASLVLIRYFERFLFVSLLFSIPIASFSKWFGLKSYDEAIASTAVYSGAIGIGITEIVLLGLYFTWFFRVTGKRDRLEPLETIDIVTMLLIFAYLVSLAGAPDVKLGLYATEYLIVHFFFYVYLSRNFRHEYLFWFILAILGTIVLEAGLGVLQNQFNKLVGVALDKGAGGDQVGVQYIVPGAESHTRATGTVYDSHTLGLYMAMLGPYFLTLMYADYIRPFWRLVFAGALTLALSTLLITFSRSAWAVGVASLAFTVFVQMVVWKDRNIMPTLLLIGIASVPAWPSAIEMIHDRIVSAPASVMDERYRQYGIALEIWRDWPIFGHGVGNFMYVLKEYKYGLHNELPVHNTILWLGCEIGLFGVLIYLWLIWLMFVRLWRVVRAKIEPYNRIALAALTGLIAYMMDGLTNPLFRDPVIFKMFWVTAALAVVLPKLQKEPMPFPKGILRPR